MGPSARVIAEQASFQAFLHCYLQEVDFGQWQVASARTGDVSGRFLGPWVCELVLGSQRSRLAIDVLYRSAVGRHRYGRVRQWLEARHCWSDIEPFHALCLLVRELHSLSADMVPELRKSRELEFLHRLTDSYGVMIRCVEHRRGDAALRDNRFIASEQSLLFGHATHPTPKSRQGMAAWQQDAYAPELAGRFRLHYFLVHKACIEEDSDAPLPAHTMAETLLSLGQGSLNLPQDHYLVPAHPLQTDWLLLQPDVMAAMDQGLIQPLGALGPEFSATSSVRTVYSEQSEWMLKFSIPVKVTNSLRVSKRHELKAGVAMSRLIRKTGFASTETKFRIIEDPAYLTVKLPGQCESGFEVIFRNNPFPRGQDAGIVSLAALTQDPLPGRYSRLSGLIEGLALNENRSMTAVARDWFQHYLDCAIGPALRLYDDHGIALEAHQQNSLLDISGGYPQLCFYRDNQGYYLSESRREELLSLCPDLQETPELFYRDAMIRDRFCYYLFVNQLLSVVARLGGDGFLPEIQLLKHLRHFLRSQRATLTGPALALVTMVLEDSRLPYKGNLLTRVHDVDELNADLEMAVYTSIANPLYRLDQSSQTPSTMNNMAEVGHDVA